MESGVSAGFKWQPPSVEHLQALLPRYEFSGLLGRGGMGAVYEAVQVKLERRVAIKLLPETLEAEILGSNVAERFRREARLMASLNHPNIVSVYDFGKTTDGQLYFVMEFVEGMDIHRYLHRNQGPLRQKHAVAIVAHVLDALGYAHDRGIVHRDIKPANIMIRSDGRVKLADFGLVRRIACPDDPAVQVEIKPGSQLTTLALGTPDYVAPEVLKPDQPVDHRVDLYAVGVMFYQLLTGEIPQGAADAPSQRNGHLDPRVDGIVRRALEYDPERRYATAAEFRAAIDPFIKVRRWK